MIAARSGRTDITNILLKGEHIDLDIQENVRHHVDLYGDYNVSCMSILVHCELLFPLITTENRMVSSPLFC